MFLGIPVEGSLLTRISIHVRLIRRIITERSVGGNFLNPVEVLISSAPYLCIEFDLHAFPRASTGRCIRLLPHFYLRLILSLVLRLSSRVPHSFAYFANEWDSHRRDCNSVTANPYLRADNPVP